MKFNRYAFLTILMEGAHKTGLSVYLSEPFYEMAENHRTSGVVRVGQTVPQQQAAVLRHFMASRDFGPVEREELERLLAELEI